MLDHIQKRLLEEIAGLHDIPAGAYNIRANGETALRSTTANIDIISKADGTGIAAAEEREICAIQKLWGEHRPGGPLVGIGSVKGNIGHTLKASMAAGVAKVALALYNRVLPPQIGAEHPVDAVTNLSSSAYLLNEVRPWITGDNASPRRAAVMGANFDAIDYSGGGASAGRSAVLILEEEPEDRS